MLVKMLKTVCGAKGTFERGANADLDEEFAGQLIGAGVAEPVALEKAADVEVAVAPETETAAKRVAPSVARRQKL